MYKVIDFCACVCQEIKGPALEMYEQYARPCHDLAALAVGTSRRACIIGAFEIVVARFWQKTRLHELIQSVAAATRHLQLQRCEGLEAAGVAKTSSTVNCVLINAAANMIVRCAVAHGLWHIGRRRRLRVNSELIDGAIVACLE